MIYRQRDFPKFLLYAVFSFYPKQSNKCDPKRSRVPFKFFLQRLFLSVISIYFSWIEASHCFALQDAGHQENHLKPRLNSNVFLSIDRCYKPANATDEIIEFRSKKPAHRVVQWGQTRVQKRDNEAKTGAEAEV